MKTIQIMCNTKDEVIIDDDARVNGINIVLVTEKHVPVARYEFDGEKVSRLTKLVYESTNVRIHFYGDITPTMIFEHTGIDGTGTYDIQFPFKKTNFGNI